MNYTLIAVLIAFAFFMGAAYMHNSESKDAGDTDTKTDTKAEATNQEEEGTEKNLSTDTKTNISILGSQRTLDLSGQGLTKAPSYVFERTDIEVLDLSDNNLSGALQAEVRHLQKLKTLDLSDNNFTGVPAEVGQLKNLEVLDLSNNPITGLPYELGNLKNLKILDLRGTSYAAQDLEVIKKGLSAGVEIRTD